MKELINCLETLINNTDTILKNNNDISDDCLLNISKSIKYFKENVIIKIIQDYLVYDRNRRCFLLNEPMDIFYSFYYYIRNNKNIIDLTFLRGFIV